MSDIELASDRVVTSGSAPLRSFFGRSDFLLPMAECSNDVNVGYTRMLRRSAFGQKQTYPTNPPETEST